MFIVVQFIKSTGVAIFAEANLRFVFSFSKKISLYYWQLSFLFGLDYQKFPFFSNLKESVVFLELVMHCSLLNDT